MFPSSGTILLFTGSILPSSGASGSTTFLALIFDLAELLLLVAYLADSGGTTLFSINSGATGLIYNLTSSFFASSFGRIITDLSALGSDNGNLATILSKP